jgi:hypothetical protein
VLSPFTQITFLFKNNADAERSRQASTFGSTDVMNGFMRDVAKATKLKITPGSIKVSSAVNDGGMGGAPAGGAAMPGQMVGQMGPGMMPGAGMMMPGGMTVGTAPGAGVPATPAKSSAGSTSAGVLTASAVLLAAVTALLVCLDC